MYPELTENHTQDKRLKSLNYWKLFVTYFLFLLMDFFDLVILEFFNGAVVNTFDPDILLFDWIKGSIDAYGEFTGPMSSAILPIFLSPSV